MDARALDRTLRQQFLYWAHAFALGNGAASLAITFPSWPSPPIERDGQPAQLSGRSGTIAPTD
jgi:hypothetical protein